MDLDNLQKLMDEYIASLDDVSKDEAWATDRQYAAGELTRFMKWLRARNLEGSESK